LWPLCLGKLEETFSIYEQVEIYYFSQKVGFSYGNSYHILKVSGTNDVLALMNKTNCGQPGAWFFRVDGVKMIEEQICESKG